MLYFSENVPDGRISNVIHDWYERIVLLIYCSGLQKSEFNSYQEVLKKFLLYKYMSLIAYSNSFLFIYFNFFLLVGG